MDALRERKAAEHIYSITAFNYPEAPVGSRDWCLFWDGWQARATLTTIPSATEPAQMNVTEEMLTRFLSWKLPSDFMPDAGITFKRVYNESSPYGPSVHEPTGTNLLTADQARAMLEHVLSSRATEPDRNAALLDLLSRGRRKLATYTAVYKGDKELRGLLEEWDAAIATRTATKD